MLGLGGLAARRPDQQYRPGGQGVTPGARSSIFARLVVIYGTGNARGLFIYNGKPGSGNPPVLCAVAPGVTADPYGNTVRPVLTVQDIATGHYANLTNGALAFGSSAADSNPAMVGPAGGGELIMSTGLTGVGGDVAGSLSFFSQVLSVGGTNPTFTLAPGPGAANPVTGAMLEVQGYTAMVLQAAGNVLVSQLAADVNFRWRMDANGKMIWGLAADTTLYRGAAGVLGVSAVAADNAGSLFTRQSMNTRGYQNNWADSGAGAVAGFYEIQAQNNKIHLAGMLSKTGTPAATEVVINLPLAYHPASNWNFPVAITNGAAAANMFFQYLSSGNLVARNMNALLNPTGIGFDVIIDLLA